jgi:LUD domain
VLRLRRPIFRLQQRDATRPLILNADAGMTGANFLVAETGAVVVCTNEGNADLCANIPDLHIVSVGIEKLIPRSEDLAIFVRMLSRSALGSPITQYTSHFRGPRQGGGEMHVVLVNNGRSEHDEIAELTVRDENLLTVDNEIVAVANGADRCVLSLHRLLPFAKHRGVRGSNSHRCPCRKPNRADNCGRITQSFCPMREALSLIWTALVGLFRSPASLAAEILVLRHQINIRRRHSPKMKTFSAMDRLIFAGLYRLAPTGYITSMSGFDLRQAQVE